MSTIDSILAQMSANDVPDPPLPLDTSGRKVTFGKGKKAWCRIHEWISPKSGKTYLFGYYGNKDQHWKVESDYVELTPEEKAKFRRDREEAERREAEARADAARRAANRAKDQWDKASPTGTSAYLERKGITPISCRFMTAPGSEGWIVVPLLRYDTSPATMVGNQKIAPDGEKRLNRGIDKVGAACRIGPEPSDGDTIYLAEGYATAVSVRMALPEHTVYMCLDTGNLAPVAQILRQRFPRSPFVFCADDDYLPTAKGEPNHAGRIKADKAAAAVGNARVVLPAFSQPRRQARDDESLPELVDFNDLHVAEGLDAVRVQLLGAAMPAQQAEDAAAVEQAAPHESDPHDEQPADPADAAPQFTIDHLVKHFALIVGTTSVWSALDRQIFKERAFVAMVGKALRDEWMSHPSRRVIKQETIRRATAAPDGGLGGITQHLDRYILLYGTTNVWDRALRKVIGLDALKAALGGGYKTWQDHPSRRVMDADCLVFDPTQRCDPDTHINLFDGLPLVPDADYSKCAAILEMLAHLCAGEGSTAFEWLKKWLAYPLQHVGAKMATAVLMHGEMHGTGKSLFFEGVYKALFGQYGATLGQHQLESQYTDWKSRKLFVLFEEVLSKDQKYNHMGTIKHTVTGQTHRINRKFMSEWEEQNHMNVVFLSNEHQPLPIEAYDRRFLVVWTEETLPTDLQARVDHEIKNGGIEAFYHYLLHMDLGDFGPHTKPPMTRAKERLIEYGLPSWERFYRDWKDKLLDIPFAPCLGDDLFIAYRRYCERGGEKPLPANKVVNMIGSRHWHGRKWVLIGQARVQRRMIVIGTRPASAASEEAWLGDAVREFKGALRGHDDDM